MSLASRLPGVGTTIFTVMSALADEHQAINLSQGFPDFDLPPGLADLLARSVHSGHNQYAPLAGVLALREAIAEKVQRHYQRSLSPESEVTVVPGATEGLFCVIMALMTPGDEAILLDPSYDSYIPAITLAGGRPIRVPLQSPDFDVDWQRVRDAVSTRTRLIIVNSPHNPTGSVFGRDDLVALEELVERHNLFVVSDEVYEHLVFDGRRHLSLLESEPIWPNLVAVFSFGKTYHATGWKTGYCVAPPELTSELRKIHQFVSFVAVTPVQCALAEFMRENPYFPMELPHFYQAKRDYLVDLLAGSPFRFKPSPGTYFQLVDYSALSDLPDVDMARRLVSEHGVATIPLSVFSEAPLPGNWLRICFAKREQTLLTAAERLCNIAPMFEDRAPAESL